MKYKVDILIYGLISAAMLLLISVGFSLVYGVSRIANFAHGGVYILVGFVVWAFLNMARLNYLLTVFLSLIITALVGMAIYRVFLIRMRGIPASEIIASFAIGMGMIELLKLVGFVGAYGNPVFVRGSVDLFGCLRGLSTAHWSWSCPGEYAFPLLLYSLHQSGIGFKGHSPG